VEEVEDEVVESNEKSSSESLLLTDEVAEECTTGGVMTELTRMLVRLRLFRLANEEEEEDEDERLGEGKPDAEVEANELRDNGVSAGLKVGLELRGDLSSREVGEGVLDEEEKMGAEERGNERKGRTKRKSFIALPWTLMSKRLARSAADLHR